MKLFFNVLLITLVTRGLYAQNETNWLPDQPGKWSYHHKLYGPIEDYKLSTDEISSFKHKIDTIIETLHQNPVLNNPVGFEPSVNVRIIDENVGFVHAPLTKLIVGARIAIQFCPYFKDESGNIKKHCIEVSSCEISSNCPKFTAESYIHFKGDGYHEELSDAALKLNRIFLKPSIVKELAEGVTAYSNGKIIIAGTQRPYWIPVTIGELFDLQLNYYELDYKLNKDEGNLYVIDAIKKEKAAFSPEELNLPAYRDNSNISSITADASGNQYMQFNPHYFDKSLPRTNIQILTVHTVTEAFTDNCEYTDLAHIRHFEFVKQFDFNALKSLLDVK